MGKSWWICILQHGKFQKEMLFLTPILTYTELSNQFQLNQYSVNALKNTFGGLLNEKWTL